MRVIGWALTVSLVDVGGDCNGTSTSCIEVEMLPLERSKFTVAEEAMMR